MVKKQVTIKGLVEPHEVCNKIQKKVKTNVKVLSPVAVHVAATHIPQVEDVADSELTTLELSVNMHCEACAQQLSRVSKVETEVSSAKVRVMGSMDVDGEKLVEYVYKTTQKQAKIVPNPHIQPEKEEDAATKPQERKEEKTGEDAKTEEKPIPKEEENRQDQVERTMMMYNYYQQPLYKIPAPQLFSDENPNAYAIC